jgi:undecaprenyl diphosphate synthase
MMENVPKHIALIMDGNRRWAVENGLSKLKGHKEGEKRIEPIVDRAIKLGIPYLTFWALAIKNWRRSKQELDILLNLYRRNLNKAVDDFHRKNVRVNVIGNLSMFPKDIEDMTKAWIKKTKNNKTITVNFALSYGGRDEIVRAINKAIHDSRFKIQELKLPITHYPLPITEKEFAQYLDTAGQPDPDLLIRTGKQRRLSGFLPWQTTYTELYFTDCLWPDFTPKELDKAIAWYKEQRRNFGA